MVERHRPQSAGNGEGVLLRVVKRLERRRLALSASALVRRGLLELPGCVS